VALAGNDDPMSKEKPFCPEDSPVDVDVEGFIRFLEYTLNFVSKIKLR
jgi:hypothetical protein